MKSPFLKIINTCIIGGIICSSLMFAATLDLPWGPDESTSSGYLSESGSKIVTLVGGDCMYVHSTVNTKYFIPTRTTTEVAAFTGHLPSGVTVADCDYNWYRGPWGSCNRSCGGGTQVATVQCIRTDGSVVADTYCSGTKPASSQSCNTQACGAPINGACAVGCDLSTESEGPQCAAGTPTSVAIDSPNKRWRYTCTGLNGGTNATNCTQKIAPNGYENMMGCLNDNGGCDWGRYDSFSVDTGIGRRFSKGSCANPWTRYQHTWNGSGWSAGTYIDSSPGTHMCVKAC